MNRRTAWATGVATIVWLTWAISARAAGAGEDVTAILRRQTQELSDAVTAGDSTIWDRYLAPDVVYVDESGELNDKRGVVGSIHPLPKDVWGKLEIAEFKVRRHGDVAIATFIVKETEGYFGQVLHCRYLTTNAWKHVAPGWRLIAAHVTALREDPPAVTLAAQRLDAYVGEYELTPTVHYTIRREGDHLLGRRTDRPEEKLEAEVADVFFVPGRPRLRKIFQRGGTGGITGFVERREAWDIAWKRLTEPRHAQ